MSSKAEELKAAGNAAFKTGNYDLALANYSTAIQLDPSVSTYALNRAAVHLKLSNWKDAERDSTTALELDGGANPKGLYRRGLARKGLGKLREAKEDFEEARRQGAGDDVAKELAALVKQLDLSGTKVNGSNEAKTNGVAKATASELASTSSPAASSPSPSTERLRAALAPPAPSSSPAVQQTQSGGLLTPVSTRRLTPADRSAPSSSSVVPESPPSSSSPSAEPSRANSFAAKKEARHAREQQPYRAQPPQASVPATTTSSAPAASSPPSATTAPTTNGSTSVLASTPSPISPFLRPPPLAAPRAAASPTSLETHFFSTAPGDPSRLAILRSLDTTRMRDWMGDGLTPDLLSAMLGEILTLFEGDAASEEERRKRDGELDWVVSLLQRLTECRRWDSAVMFLEEREREGVKRVLDEAEERIVRVSKSWGL